LKKQYELDHEGEPSLRYTENAERLEKAAAIALENAWRCLEAAEAKAAEKRARKEQRRALRQAARDAEARS
jgi:hypothetical protein